jgi:hypothetical protein
VRAALRSRDKLTKLLRIGADSRRSRVEALEARLKKWIRAGKMGQKAYHVAQNEFV